ncbi:MAG: hypothetical protein U1E83_08395 [Methylotetracoccus sp.]
MMFKNIFKLAMLSVLGLAPFAANAHECRSLGLASAWGIPGDKTTPPLPVPDQYYLCVGFSGEDPAHGIPGAGKPNNLDFYPIYLPGADGFKYSSLDTAKGDKVDITATLYWLSDYVFDIPFVCAWPYDAASCPGVQPPTLFFRQLNVAYDKNGNPTAKGTTGYGYEQPIALKEDGTPVYENKITKFKKFNWEGTWAYRAPKDFILPAMGSYAWVVTGTVQKKGKPAVMFNTKWTCQAPRIPYGPYDLNDIDGTISAAPEGWFDCVRYAESPTASAAPNLQPSPSVKMLMERKGLKLAN